MISTYIKLFLLSVQKPAEAARFLFSRNLSRNALWTALALVAVLNTLIYIASLILVPSSAPMPVFLTSPVIILTLQAYGLTTFVFALFWIGRLTGGKARFPDVLTAITWLQFMRLGLQLVALLIMFVVPPQTASLAVMAAGFYGIWILINFLKVAYGFNELFKVLLVIILSALGVISLSAVLMTIGGEAIGLFG